MVSDLLQGLTITSLSAPFLVGVTVLAVVRGYLVPRSTVEQIRQDRDTRVDALTRDRELRIGDAKAVAIQWEQAYHQEREARVMQDQLLRDVLPSLEALDDLLVALRKAHTMATPDRPS